MNIEEKIKRINELYHKSQAEGLTEEEKAEQARLRAEYVANIRANLKSQLDNISIQESDGSITELGKKYGAGDCPMRKSRQRVSRSSRR